MGQYVGARYVPDVTGNSYDPTQAYENLVVVDNGMGTSYISRKPVPAGIPLTNTEYWAIYGAANGAIINLQNQIDQIKDGFVTLDMFGAVGDGVTDDTAAVITALTDGANVLGDPSKTYLVSGGHEISTANIAVIGLHIKADCANNTDTDYYGACLKFTGDNLTFIDLAITGQYNHGFVMTGDNIMVVSSDFEGTQPDTVTPPEPAGTSSKPIVALEIHGTTNALVENCKFHDIHNDGANVARGLLFAGHFSNCTVNNSVFDTVTAYEDGDALQFINEYREHTHSRAVNCSFFKCSKRCIKLQARGVIIDGAHYDDVGLSPAITPSTALIALFESDITIKNCYLATDTTPINIIISTLEAAGETYEHCTISNNKLVNMLGDQTGVIETKQNYNDIKVISNEIIGAHDTPLGGGTQYNLAFKIGQNNTANDILIAENDIDCGQIFGDFANSGLGNFTIVNNTFKGDYGIIQNASSNGNGVVVGNNWYAYYNENTNYNQKTLVSQYLTDVVAKNNAVPSNYRDYMPVVGPSNRRPTSNVYDGYMFVDTTLNKPLWYINGSWYDATGTIVA